jgi:hypothetical protein
MGAIDLSGGGCGISFPFCSFQGREGNGFRVEPKEEFSLSSLLSSVIPLLSLSLFI